MTPAQLSNKSNQQQAEIRSLKRRLTKLNKYISTLVEAQEVSLSGELIGIILFRNHTSIFQLQ